MSDGCYHTYLSMLMHSEIAVFFRQATGEVDSNCFVYISDGQRRNGGSNWTTATMSDGKIKKTTTITKKKMKKIVVWVDVSTVQSSARLFRTQTVIGHVETHYLFEVSLFTLYLFCKWKCALKRRRLLGIWTEAHPYTGAIHQPSIHPSIAMPFCKSHTT